MTPYSATPVIPLPRLVLRVAFAGNRSLPAEANISASLSEVWRTLGQRLVEIAPCAPAVTAGKEPAVAAYFSTENPLLRLITGLAEGADAVAWTSLQAIAADKTSPFTHHLNIELAAVLPCELKDYRLDRDQSHLPSFDKQVTQCTYVTELDGIITRDGSELSKKRRGRAFRAQSAVLLRQAEILVAVADPEAPGKPGGTMETVRNALDFDIPVIFVHAVTGEIRLVDAIEDLAVAFATGPTEPWQQTLRDWTTKIIADPDTSTPESARHGEPQRPNKGQLTLQEFFYGTTPPVDAAHRRIITWHEKRWASFSKRFKSGIKPRVQTETPPYQAWRTRSKELNYHYSGLYRGTFFLNAVRAVLAVTCAALTLVLLGAMHSPKASDVHDLAEKIATHVSPASTTAAMPHAPAHTTPALWLILTLLSLALLKLYLVFSIYRNTHQANHGGWNDKAVDYRYLAERLRSLYCLPQLGSFQPPAAARPQYSSRIARQSAIDWLFDAIVRSHSPAGSPHVQPQPFTTADGTVHSIPTLRIQPQTGLAACAEWADSQYDYHDKSSEEMHAMHRWAERWGARLGKVVIGIVSFDIIALIADVFKLLPPTVSHTLHGAAPWLVLLTALLPAAVAGLNAIRFQSECRRLADRSDFMVKILKARRTQITRLQESLTEATAAPATDPASWTPESLRLAERVAADLAQEVSEWSVLYGKEVHEP